jgi:hypothetical protein
VFANYGIVVGVVVVVEFEVDLMAEDQVDAGTHRVSWEFHLLLHPDPYPIPSPPSPSHSSHPASSSDWETQFAAVSLGIHSSAGVMALVAAAVVVVAAVVAVTADAAAAEVVPFLASGEEEREDPSSLLPPHPSYPSLLLHPHQHHQRSSSPSPSCSCSYSCSCSRSYLPYHPSHPLSSSHLDKAILGFAMAEAEILDGEGMATAAAVAEGRSVGD